MVFDVRQSNQWATALGLADVPLFQESLQAHKVMLDGSDGCFALSLNETPDISTTPIDWIWSSSLPHHIEVGSDNIAVRRWDSPFSVEKFSIKSVTNQIDTFYDYLTEKKFAPRYSVVDHALSLFRRIRHTITADNEAVRLYLTVLDALSKAKSSQGSWDEVETKVSSLGVLGASQANKLAEIKASVDEFLTHQNGNLNTVAELAIRHAGSMIFEEAHYEICARGEVDLFGLPSIPLSTKKLNYGVHYTPPSLARTLVEQSLRALNLNTTELAILDPACGAGSFLHETLRFLSKKRFAGRIKLKGYDISAVAIEMARFNLNQAKSDYHLPNNIEIVLETTDFLPLRESSRYDLILMNPPFIAYPSLSEGQRAALREVLSDKLFKGRPDYCMGFITKAQSILKEGGVLGSLFPASLLGLESASYWRKNITENCDIQFLAKFGDYGIFSSALVQVAALVVKEKTIEATLEPLGLWTNNDRQSTSIAMRRLRQENYSSNASLTKQWWVSPLPNVFFQKRLNWSINQSTLELGESDFIAQNSPKVSDFFSVTQGVRTGLNEAFLVSDEELNKLPETERKYFKQAVSNKQITEGRILQNLFVFFPYKSDRLLFNTEEDLKNAVPAYFDKILLPHKTELSRRALVNQHWWELTRKRKSQEGGKIVSKYFANTGGFAFDKNGKMTVVQGYSWFPTQTLKRDFSKISSHVVEQEIVSYCLLQAYTNLFNSKFFFNLVREFCPQVAGGQFDMSQRHTKDIPLPNLAQIFVTSGELVSELDKIKYEPSFFNRIEDIVKLIYRIK